jgi:hypothetical protein
MKTTLDTRICFAQKKKKKKKKMFDLLIFFIFFLNKVVSVIDTIRVRGHPIILQIYIIKII